MEIGEIITTVIAALGGGGIGSLIGWGAKKRQENAAAAKTETEVKGDQIENIEKMVEKAYKPIIKDLTEQIRKLQDKVDKLDEDKDRLSEKVDVLEEENRKLRSIIREVRPDLVPAQRGENGKTAPRSKNGRFAKKEDRDGE